MQRSDARVIVFCSAVCLLGIAAVPWYGIVPSGVQLSGSHLLGRPRIYRLRCPLTRTHTHATSAARRQHLRARRRLSTRRISPRFSRCTASSRLWASADTHWRRRRVGRQQLHQRSLPRQRQQQRQVSSAAMRAASKLSSSNRRTSRPSMTATSFDGRTDRRRLFFSRELWASQ